MEQNAAKRLHDTSQQEGWRKSQSTLPRLQETASKTAEGKAKTGGEVEPRRALRQCWEARLLPALTKVQRASASS